MAVVLMMACQKTEAPAVGGKVHLPWRSADFGAVVQGESVTVAFRIQNKGALPLVLSPLKTSCGCVATGSGGVTIGPDASEMIDVDIDTAGRSGRFRGTVKAETSDPGLPTVALTITGQILRPIEPLPPMMDLGVRGVGSEGGASVMLTTPLDLPIRVDAIRTSVPWLHAEYDERKGVLSGRIAAEAPIGFLSGNHVEVSLSSPLSCTIKVPVVGRITSDLYAEPDGIIDLADISQDSGATADLFIRSHSGRRTTIEGIRVMPRSVHSESIRADAVEGPGGPGHVRLQIRPGAAKGALFGRLWVVATNGDDSQEFKLAFWGTVVPAGR